MAQYTEPADLVQRVCDHPAEIITLQKEITDLMSQQFLPPQCDYTEIENQIQVLRKEREAAKRRPAAPRMDKELQQGLADMTQDAQQSGEEVHSLRTQLANGWTLAARAAPAASQAPEDRCQKVSDSLVFSWSDRTQLRGWIVQLRLVIRDKPASFPNEQTKMQYSFNRLRRVGLGHILPHVQEDGTIGLEDLPAFIQLLEAAFMDPNQAATAEQKMWEIKHKNR